jgi:hypothetical protein
MLIWRKDENQTEEKLNSWNLITKESKHKCQNERYKIKRIQNNFKCYGIIKCEPG